MSAERQIHAAEIYVEMEFLMRDVLYLITLLSY